MKARALIALFASVVALGTSPALAQMSEGERKAAARAAYQEGVKLEDAGRPAEALGRFEAAQKLYDAPTHLLHIAENQALIGKLVESAETYETLLHIQLERDAPAAFVQAQEQARAEAPALRQRIPTLRVVVKPEAKTLQNLVIVSNDRQIPNELVGISRPVNPGSYRISASATGWATPTPVDLEIKEREAKSIELVLQQGATAPVVAQVPPPYGTADQPSSAPSGPVAPPPKKKDTTPQTGLLFGVHGGVFVPSGSLAESGSGQNIAFDSRASTGGGFGVDFFARFAKVFLAGFRGEGIFLGGPDPNTIAGGNTVTSKANMFGGAIAIGVLTSQDKVGFLGDLGLGFRRLNYSDEEQIGGASVSHEQSFSGTYFALGAGLSIPAGAIRIVPKVGLDLGSLKPTDSCFSPDCLPTSATGQSFNQSGGYQMFFVGVSLFYSLDLGKKPSTTSARL